MSLGSPPIRSRLPAVGGLSIPLATPRAIGVCPPVLAALDGSSSTCAAGPRRAGLPGAVTVQVPKRAAGRTGAVVSHFNKAHKGRLARLLATTTAEPDDVVRLRSLLRRAGLHVEHDGGRPSPWSCLRPDRPRDVNSVRLVAPNGPGVT